MMTKSIKLTGRVTENKSSKADVDFVKKKMNQGMKQAAIIREAIRVYRRFEEGQLFIDVLKEFEIERRSNGVIDNNAHKTITQSLDKKLISGKWGL